MPKEYLKPKRDIMKQYFVVVHEYNPRRKCLMTRNEIHSMFGADKYMRIVDSLTVRMDDYLRICVEDYNVYIIRLELMTSKEFSELPEFEGWDDL